MIIEINKNKFRTQGKVISDVGAQIKLIKFEVLAFFRKFESPGGIILFTLIFFI